MQTRKLGASGPIVSAIGLGCMAMSDIYGPSDRRESIATIHAALDAGITLLDTGDFYGMGHNELLLHEALRDARRDSYLLSVKFGAQRGPDGSWLGYDARPASVKTALAYSLRRLGVDYIDIYRPARLDPNVPIEDTVGAIGEMIDKGYVRYVGLSEVGAETILRADRVRRVVDVQIEYALISRGIESTIVPRVRELGIAITAYGVLSRGLLSHSASEAARTRARFPRFQGENLQRNLQLVAAIQALGAEWGLSVQELAIAWVLARGKDIVPLIGARRREQLAQALSAVDAQLSAEDIARIERVVPAGAAAGERYDSHAMRQLDSERVEMPRSSSS
jgi:aryl-alcohol dehydrogenase-like predicted oxidoreductase